MKVKLMLHSASTPKEYDEIFSVYQKGSFLCIASKEQNFVHKYPISDVFRVEHPYS